MGLYKVYRGAAWCVCVCVIYIYIYIYTYKSLLSCYIKIDLFDCAIGRNYATCHS